MTVPTLIVKYQKEQTVTRLKKAYSALSQTTARAIADNGPVKTWILGKKKSKETAEKYLLPYLSVGKICGYTDRTGECNLKHAPLDDKTNYTNWSNNYYIFYLQDGTAIIVYNVTDTKVYTIVDINGVKGPNLEGRDIFTFTFRHAIEGRIVPYCLTYGLSREEMLTDVSACGQDIIMVDGWQIKDDYPW